MKEWRDITRHLLTVFASRVTVVLAKPVAQDFDRDNGVQLGITERDLGPDVCVRSEGLTGSSLPLEKVLEPSSQEPHREEGPFTRRAGWCLGTKNPELGTGRWHL